MIHCVQRFPGGDRGSAARIGRANERFPLRSPNSEREETPELNNINTQFAFLKCICYNLAITGSFDFQICVVGQPHSSEKR